MGFPNVKLIGGDKAVAEAMVDQVAVKATAGRVFEASVFNNGGADLYLAVVDKASAAVNGDEIVQRVKIPAGSFGYLSWPTGRPMGDGIQVCLSSTVETVTLPATDVGCFDVTYN